MHIQVICHLYIHIKNLCPTIYYNFDIIGGDNMADLQQLSISARTMIDNPSGSGSAFLASRRSIKKALDQGYSDIVHKSGRYFIAIPFMDINGGLLFRVKVPSEDYKHNKIAYDVFIEIEPERPDRKLKASMREIRVYSNCPSFIFTYAYVFNKLDRIIPNFKDKIPKKALEEAPKIRNPVETLGFEKSIYYACRYLLDNQCLSNGYIRRFARRLDTRTEDDLKRSIVDPDKIVALYQYARSLQIKDRKKIDQRKRSDRADEMKNYEKLQQQNYKSKIIGKPKMTAKAAEKIKPRPAITSTIVTNKRNTIKLTKK